jgi:predicted PurR-regulated permease PerM
MTLSPAGKLLLSWCALLAAALALAWWLAPVVAPFLAAAVLAYALEPAVARLARPRGRLPRVVAIALTETVLMLAVVGVLALLVPILSRELPLLKEQIPLQTQRLVEQVNVWLAQFGIGYRLDFASLKLALMDYAKLNLDDGLKTLLSSALSGGNLLITLMTWLVLVPVIAFYLLMDWNALLGGLHRFVPERHAPAALDLFGECDQVLGQYLRGQLLVMLLLAVYYSLALALAGFELAVPVGVFTGLAVCIPYLGFGLSALLALLAGTLQFLSIYGLVTVAVVYGVGQVIEGFFLTPRLVGQRIGLHPVAVLLALFVFGHLFGFVGVLLALPAGAVVQVLLRRLAAGYFASRLYAG